MQIQANKNIIFHYDFYLILILRLDTEKKQKSIIHTSINSSASFCAIINLGCNSSISFCIPVIVSEK